MTHQVTERWLREELVRMRNDRGWTIAHVVRLTGMHTRTIERIERGPDLVSAKSLASLMHVYDVEPADRTRLRDMQERAGVMGWWDDWHDVGLSPAYAEHCELEEVATGVDLYCTLCFDGLLQSPAYAAYMQEQSPQEHLRRGPTAERFIALRGERQKRFWSRVRKVRVLLDESLLLTRRGPLAEQMSYVRDLETRGVLTARVIPVKDPVAIPDTLGVFTAGKRKTACLGGFIEHHPGDEWAVTRAQQFFELGWNRALPLFGNG